MSGRAALVLGVGIHRVEGAVAGVQVGLPVELGAAALAVRLEGDRALGEFRAVRRRQQRYFRHLVLIDVGGLGSLVARIEQVGAVRRHGQRAIRLGAVGAEGWPMGPVLLAVV